MAMFRVVLGAVLLGEVAGLQLVGTEGSWPGLATPLTEAGYQYLLSMNDNSQLWRFIRRVVASYGGGVLNETSFDTFVTNSWNKPEKQRTLDALINDLSAAKFLEGFSSSGDLFEFPQARKGPHAPSVSLFIAGLEGSGHHFVKLLMDSCVTLGACHVDPELTRTLWDSREDKASLTQAWSEAAGRVQEFPNSATKLRVLNAYDRTDRIGELTYTGMMTYPSFSPQWVPRLDTYSEVAREAGDNLYALVLVRDATATLCTDYTKFHHTEEEEIEALRLLTQQLRDLPPSTYRCVDYDALPAMPRTTNLFLSELFHSSRTGVLVSDMIAKNFNPSNSTCSTEVSAHTIERFAEAQEPLFHLCRAADSSAPLVDVFSEAHAVHHSPVGTTAVSSAE